MVQIVVMISAQIHKCSPLYKHVVIEKTQPDMSHFNSPWVTFLNHWKQIWLEKYSVAYINALYIPCEEKNLSVHLIQIFIIVLILFCFCLRIFYIYLALIFKTSNKKLSLLNPITKY